MQTWNNKVKPIKLDTSSSDCTNVKRDVGKRDNKNSILLKGDSPARGCSVSLRNKLNNACHVIGIIKPGSVINTLTSMVKSNMDKIPATNAIVFWGGTNDVKHNNSHDELKHLINYVQSKAIQILL
jgi:hypothetical protein